jgi:DNA processing protein
MASDFERLSLASLFLPAGTLTVTDFKTAQDQPNRAKEGCVDLSLVNLTATFARAGRSYSLPTKSPLLEVRRFSSFIESKIDAAWHLLHQLRATIVYPFHPAYPQSFYELETPPLYLSCAGNLGALCAPERVAVVGSRELSTRSERWLESHLSEFLLEHPHAVIISGGARGADQAAHLAAVRAGRPTIVFLPSGLNQIFPVDLQPWLGPILDAGGLFVSAYAPDDSVRKFRFEARNRLIASLGHFTFVVEASRRSGTMMTARLSRDLGRELCVLPSFPGDPAGQGNLDLLSNGAQLICDATDLSVMMSRNSMPGSAQTQTGSDCEEAIDHPHRDDRRQLPFVGGALSDDIENVVNDNQPDTHDHPA